jgi:hypothetical protein
LSNSQTINEDCTVPNITIISKKQHRNSRWKRPNNFNFAANDALCPLVVHEFPQAIMSLPVGFIPLEQGYTPVAILGLEQGKNLLVDAQGKWRGRYIPNAYRCHPFLLADGEDDKRILCIDEDIGIADDGEDGESIFGEDGEASETISSILDFLNKNSINRKPTKIICDCIQKHGLIEPWPIAVMIDDENRGVSGVFRINETALNALSRTALKELRDCSALVVVYSQLLSMGHLQNLAQEIQSTPEIAPSELNFDAFSSESGSLNFDNL